MSGKDRPGGASPASHPFAVDRGRLYEVGRDGIPRTDGAEPMEWLGARHRRLLASFAGASLVVGALAAASAFCLVLGARFWAAVAALAALAAAPLLLLGHALDWWRHRRGRWRRHRRRPDHFPRGGGG
jgi:hypothetical protein